MAVNCGLCGNVHYLSAETYSGRIGDIHGEQTGLRAAAPSAMILDVSVA
jgi:hypothetical protein